MASHHPKRSLCPHHAFGTPIAAPGPDDLPHAPRHEHSKIIHFHRFHSARGFRIPAFAQRHDLFVNRDGKAVIERTFPTLAEAIAPRGAMYESKPVSDVGCTPSNPGPTLGWGGTTGGAVSDIGEKRPKAAGTRGPHCRSV